MYSYRFVILAIYSISTLYNNILWVSLAPIATDTARAFDVTETKVNAVTVLYMAFYPPFSFVSNYILQKYGIRVGLMIGISLTCIGAGIKCMI